MSDTQLPDIPLEALEDVGALYRAVEALRDNLEKRLHGDAIAELNLTASVGYTASELQAVSDKVDTILIALKTAGLIE